MFTRRLDLQLLRPRRLDWPSGAVQWPAAPRRTGVGSNPAVDIIVYRVMPALGRCYSGYTCVTQDAFNDTLAERSKAVAQGAIP